MLIFLDLAYHQNHHIGEVEFNETFLIAYPWCEDKSYNYPVSIQIFFMNISNLTILHNLVPRLPVTNFFTSIQCSQDFSIFAASLISIFSKSLNYQLSS